MDNEKSNPIEEKTYSFSLRIIRLYQYLISQKNIPAIANQVLRSGTSIGALVREAAHAQSKADFLNKMNIALKEANETDYWLSLMHDSNYLTETEYVSIGSDCREVLKLLISIVKTTKEKLKK